MAWALRRAFPRIPGMLGSLLGQWEWELRDSEADIHGYMHGALHCAQACSAELFTCVLLPIRQVRKLGLTL